MGNDNNNNDNNNNRTPNKMKLPMMTSTGEAIPNADFKDLVKSWCDDNKPPGHALPGGSPATQQYGAIENWNTELVTDMSAINWGATEQDGLITGTCNPDVTKWNTHAVTDFTGMFSNAYNFNRDISKWDVSKATSLAGMFFNCPFFNRDLNGWNTGNVIDMSNVFANNVVQSDSGNPLPKYDQFNGDISDWDTSRVRTLRNMFANAVSFNQDLSKWDVSKVTDLS